jgi:hypothetical protein
LLCAHGVLVLDRFGATWLRGSRLLDQESDRFDEYVCGGEVGESGGGQGLVQASAVAGIRP